MEMRYRLPELMEKRGWTAYRVAKETGWRIQASTVHRIAAKQGKVGAFDPSVMAALMDAFGFVELDELIDQERKRTRKRSD